MLRLFSFFFFFFFNDTATTEIYTLSLHDALPIYRRLDPQHVAWVCSRLVFDHRLAGGGPDSIAVEQIHARAAGERLPARALQQRQQRGLVQVTERVAIVRIHRQLDGGERCHGMDSGKAAGIANVCQKTTRCTFHVPRRSRTPKAFAPYVESRTSPCCAASWRAASPSTVGEP